jgi:phosphatidylglycerol---prolipoprotein diacylglyceryl transferase
MFPTLGHLFSAIFGVEIEFPLPTYGFLLASAFFAAYVVMRSELRRKWKIGLIPSTTEKVIKGKGVSTGDLVTYGFFGFLTGWKILGIVLNYKTFVKDVQGYVFSLEGSIAGGVFIAAVFIWWYYRVNRKSRLPEPVETMEEVPPQKHAAAILLVAAFSGIVGAKIFHQLENFREFLQDPIGNLFSAGGLTFYGGLIFGVIAVLWFVRKKKIPWLQMMDVAAPAVILAYGVGRMGCMLSGDGCWGIPNLNPKPEWLHFLPDWMWSYNFPHNVINNGIPLQDCNGHYCHVLPVPVWPTPFYESMISIAFFFVLWGIRKSMRAPGSLFAIFFVMNGVERFFIEKIRVNNRYDLGSFSFTQAELISVLLVILGITGIIIFQRWYNKKKATAVSNDQSSSA